MSNNYSVYQCSVCRRIKDVPRDNVRAFLNQCTITKGCSGILQAVGETTVLSPTPPQPGLTNWFPRGETPVVTPVAPSEQLVNLSTSRTGVVTLALLLDRATALANPTVLANFTQRATADVSFTEYQFNVAAPTTLIAGTDSTGKNLRFSTAQVAANEVTVLVNGVGRTPGTGPLDYSFPGYPATSSNSIQFVTPLPAGAIVEVSVYASPPVTSVQLTFTANYSFTVSANSSAWGNVRFVDSYDPTTGAPISQETGQLWWLYSCTGTGIFSNSSAALFTGAVGAVSGTELTPVGGSFKNCRFLLCAPPYDNADRYLNFYVDAQVLSENFFLSSQVTTADQLLADEGALVEVYPPLQLWYNSISAGGGASSFVTADTFPTGDAVSTDTPEILLTGTKIIGPV